MSLPYFKANDHEIWWCHTTSKAQLRTDETFGDVMTMTFYGGILYFRLHLGRKIENRNFFVFHPICLRFYAEGNFEMLITKRRPKLKLEHDLSKKL